ncbi:Metaxin-1 [Podospora conica]|nr:Metaxin-1 [Schizothecium conicum]
MVLQLHVWGPAFGLPSIDAECLATIAYFAQTLDSSEYQLIQSSPSAVPTHQLPTLHDPTTDTWTASFSAITRSLPLTADPAPSRKAQSHATAYAAYLAQNATPLLALSLYVSSDNWTTTVRPAYTAILPLPLPWTEPPAIRAAMAQCAEPLGMSSLDTDAEAEREEAAGAAAEAKGWIQVPRGLIPRRKGVAETLTPEQRAKIRLEGLTRDVLDVLAEAEWEGQTRAARCLTWGYLALMLVPEVPRGWLREIMRARYGGLCAFVEEGRREWFGGIGWEGLPWAEEVGGKGEKGRGRRLNAGGDTIVGVGARFVNGLLFTIPQFGDEWARFCARRSWRVAGKGREGVVWSARNLLLMIGTGLTLVVGTGLWVYYKPKFGARTQVWTRAAPSVLGLGTAGFMFGQFADPWRSGLQ